MKIGIAIFLCLFFFVWYPPQGRAQQLIRGGWGRGGPSFCLVQDLRLTQQQIDRMRTIQRRYLEEIRALRNDLLNKRYDLERLLSDPQVKPSEIKAKQREVFLLENQIQERLLDYQLKVRDILTPQQFEAWVSRNRMSPGHRMHHGRGMGMMHQ